MLSMFWILAILIDVWYLIIVLTYKDFFFQIQTEDVNKS